MPRRVLFDINVVLDVIEARVPHNQFSGPCLAMAEAGEITGMIAACSIDTLADLLARDMSPIRARAIVSSLLIFLKLPRWMGMRFLQPSKPSGMIWKMPFCIRRPRPQIAIVW